MNEILMSGNFDANYIRERAKASLEYAMTRRNEEVLKAEKKLKDFEDKCKEFNEQQSKLSWWGKSKDDKYYENFRRHELQIRLLTCKSAYSNQINFLETLFYNCDKTVDGYVYLTDKGLGYLNKE